MCMLFIIIPYSSIFMIQIACLPPTSTFNSNSPYTLEQSWCAPLLSPQRPEQIHRVFTHFPYGDFRKWGYSKMDI